MKKHFGYLILMLLAMCLVGCSFRTADQLYRLPKRSESYYDLQSAIDQAMAGLEYCAPLAGEQRQTVHMADLDGDDQQEYLVFAKGGTELPLRILIFDRVGDSYIHVDTVESSGSYFDQVEYVQMDTSPGMEIIVGRQVSDQVLRSLSVYRFSSSGVEQMVSTGYTKFLTVDLDEDSYMELFVIRPGQSETDRGIAALFELEEGNVARSVEVNMSEAADRLKRVLIGKLHGGRTAVYLASAVEGASLITDVYAIVNDGLTNVTFSNESGTSVKTMRNYYVYADDIDSDGVVELPYLITTPQVAQEDPLGSHHIIRWYAMTLDGGEVDKVYTYHNFQDGWYLELDSTIAYDITVTQNGNQYEFHLWDEDRTEGQKLLSVAVLTGQNRTEQATAEGRFVIYQTDTKVYSGQLTDLAQKLGITQKSFADSFHLIRQDWKTGET